MSAHNGSIDTGFDGGCWALCSCGWEGDYDVGNVDAHLELAQHYREAPEQDRLRQEMNQ